jgi:hypothetical protein
MANATALFGFRHIGFLSGGAPDFQMQPRAIQSTNSTKIGNGDPVLKDTNNTGYIVRGSGALATTTPIEGVFQGCQCVPSAGVPPTWLPSFPGSTQADATGYIINAPNALFLVGTLQTALVTANIGNAINFTTGTPNAQTGFSVALVDQATATATGTTASLLPFKVVQLYQGIGNGSDPTTNNNWVVVTFNNQMFRTLASGV